MAPGQSGASLYPAWLALGYGQLLSLHGTRALDPTALLADGGVASPNVLQYDRATLPMALTFIGMILRYLEKNHKLTVSSPLWLSTTAIDSKASSPYDASRQQRRCVS